MKHRPSLNDVHISSWVPHPQFLEGAGFDFASAGELHDVWPLHPQQWPANR